MKTFFEIAGLVLLGLIAIVLCLAYYAALAAALGAAIGAFFGAVIWAFRALTGF